MKEAFYDYVKIKLGVFEAAFFFVLLKSKHFESTFGELISYVKANIVTEHSFIAVKPGPL
jgi:hypothetical protein